VRSDRAALKAPPPQPDCLDRDTRDPPRGGQMPPTTSHDRVDREEGTSSARHHERLGSDEQTGNQEPLAGDDGGSLGSPPLHGWQRRDPLAHAADHTGHVTVATRGLDGLRARFARGLRGPADRQCGLAVLPAAHGCAVVIDHGSGLASLLRLALLAQRTAPYSTLSIRWASNPGPHILVELNAPLIPDVQ